MNKIIITMFLCAMVVGVAGAEKAQAQVLYGSTTTVATSSLPFMSGVAATTTTTIFVPGNTTGLVNQMAILRTQVTALLGKLILNIDGQVNDLSTSTVSTTDKAALVTAMQGVKTAWVSLAQYNINLLRSIFVI